MKKVVLILLLLLLINSFSWKAQHYVPLLVDSTHWFIESYGQGILGSLYQ